MDPGLSLQRCRISIWLTWDGAEAEMAVSGQRADGDGPAETRSRGAATPTAGAGAQGGGGRWFEKDVAGRVGSEEYTGMKRGGWRCREAWLRGLADAGTRGRVRKSSREKT